MPCSRLAVRVGKWRALKLICLVCIFHTQAMVNAKTIVFIPIPQASHVRSHMNVARELSSLGHSTYISVPDVILRKDSVYDSRVHVLPYGDTVDDVGELILSKSRILDNFWAGKVQDIFAMYELGTNIWKNSMDVLSDDRLWSGIQNVKPDLIVLDWTPFCKTLLAVPYKLGVRFAFFGTSHDMVNSRVPHTPACNPEMMSDLDDHMTISGRIQNTLIHMSFMFFNPFCDENIIQKFVPEKPPITISSLSAQAEIFLAETDHVIDYARPMLPNTKLIGGTVVKPAKPLSEPFTTFVNDAMNGVIVVTFGSSVLNVPAYISQKMASAFMRLNLRVVWRINFTSPDSSKLLTSTWIPQNDLLGHNNTVMFVSHCGMNGQYEALYHGIPLLCLPLFADQFYNARRIVNKGYGLRADIRHISADHLAQMITDVAYNNTYRQNIQKGSQIFRLLYKEPRKEAGFWLDHVLHFGGEHMRFEGQMMPLYQYLLFDVFTILICLCIFILLLVFTTGYTLYKCLNYVLCMAMYKIKTD